MVISILLLSILFVLGFIIVFNFPVVKNIFSVLYSFFLNKSSAATPISRSSTLQAPRNLNKTRDHKKEELQRVFLTFDKNGDGFITKEELRESLKNLGLFRTEEEAEEMFSKIDMNKDGLIEFDEFRLLLSGKSLKPAREAEEKNIEEEDEEGEEGGDDDDGVMKEAFGVFDKDKDGLISEEELGLILRSLGLKEGMKMEDVKEMIRRVDEDGDGMVSFGEFKKMMKSRFANNLS